MGRPELDAPAFLRRLDSEEDLGVVIRDIAGDSDRAIEAMLEALITMAEEVVTYHASKSNVECLTAIARMSGIANASKFNETEADWFAADLERIVVRAREIYRGHRRTMERIPTVG